jgi:hypothetical protein
MLPISIRIARWRTSGIRPLRYIQMHIRTLRLLERNSTGEFSLTKDFVGDDVPQYAILSHTWEADAEVTFKDLIDGTGKSKLGYDKIRFCAEQSRRDSVQYF